MTLTEITTRRDDADGLGDLIRQARERAGMRQTDLAARIHRGLSAVQSWESGKHVPPASFIPALAEALGVRFVADTDGRWLVEDPKPRPQPVVVVVASPAKAAEVVRRVQAGLDPQW